jgi:hypothetical protein
MRLWFFAVVLLTSATSLWCGALPLTMKEVGLMLRSGYSSEAVLREVSTRKLSDACDEAMEKQLKQVGATAALVNALRNPAYQVSTSQPSVVRRPQTTQPLLASVANGQARTAVDSISQTNPPLSGGIPPADQVYRILKGNLVTRQSGVLAPFDDETLQSKKLFLYFISANWSPPGRAFTPRLVEYYDRIVKEHPEIEIVFFSADRSEFGMETYMNQSRMPWPAVTFAAVGQQVTAMRIDVTHDVPALILLESSGKLLSRSKASGGGLDEVLAALDRILAQGAAVASGSRP